MGSYLTAHSVLRLELVAGMAQITNVHILFSACFLSCRLIAATLLLSLSLYCSCGLCLYGCSFRADG